MLLLTFFFLTLGLFKEITLCTKIVRAYIVKVLVTQSVMSSSLQPRDCDQPGSSVPGILQARILEWGSYPLLQGTFPTQGSNLQVDSLPSEPH